MLISLSHKFIFIRNYKTAGTSIYRLFAGYQPFYLRNRYVRYILLKLRKNFPFYNLKYLMPVHADAKQVSDQIPAEIYSNFFKFGFVRNPWAWQVSLYFFMLERKAHYQHKLVKKFKSFDEYIEGRVASNKKLQKDFFADANGNIAVDYIGKVENLQKDIRFICDRVGIAIKGAPHLNKSKHRDYRHYYSDYSAKLIADHYKEDIEHFNYRF